MTTRQSFDIAPLVVAQVTATETSQEQPHLVIFTTAGSIYIHSEEAIKALRDACDFALGEPT